MNCLNDLENPILLHNYQWNRVILDEGHEYINNSKKVKVREIRAELKHIKSNFRWICSGTPFGCLRDLARVINYITNIQLFDADDNEIYATQIEHYKHIFDTLLHNMFRKNTKDSVKEEDTL